MSAAAADAAAAIAEGKVISGPGEQDAEVEGVLEGEMLSLLLPRPTASRSISLSEHEDEAVDTRDEDDAARTDNVEDVSGFLESQLFQTNINE